MAKKLNSMPDYQARMPKHPHDVGQSLTFTASTGMELPIYYDMLHLGDELHFNGNLFARLNPLITAALAEIDLHVDYFFVPLSVIYTPAPSLFYQTDDLLSSTIADNENFVKDKFPLYDLDSSIRLILGDSIGLNHAQWKDSQTYPTTRFDCIGKSVLRLLDLFDYSYINLFSSDQYSSNPKTTPWFLAAYQACHELYFRNDDREPKQYHYNLDKHFFTSLGFSGLNLLRLNYVSRYKDYFYSAKVSPIGSSVSMLNGENSYRLLTSVNSFIYNNGSYFRADSNGDFNSSTVVSDITSVSHVLSQQVGDYAQLNSANIRQLFMVDKLLRVTGRASKDYESQFLAHFGIKIPHDVLHNITHIGHDMCTLSPSPVISSANTWDSAAQSGSALGEIGGQGQVSMNGRKRNFTAPCHGVFMAIFHAQPKMRYEAGVNKLHNLSSPMDFWQPEYDRKGMQPIFSYETNRDVVISSNRLGWQFAYEQFKRKYDRVSVAFKNVSNYTRPTVNNYYPWVLSENPYGYGVQSSLDYTDFLANPHLLDGILQVKYQSTWIDDLSFENAHTLFYTDPFIIDFRMENKKVNYMSEFGEPELD